MSASTSADLDLGAPLVIGFGITGQAIARALVRRGPHPVIIDDRPNEAGRAIAAELACSLIEAPDLDRLRAEIVASTVVLPSPGIPASHPLFALSAEVGRPIRSEFDLAALWDQRPLVGITGTNGKTTVTMLVTDALERSGIRAAAAGNTEVPLVEALGDESLDVFVVEASSFRLEHSGRFRPGVATWLNFAPDHLDAHTSLAAYEAAKASLWADLPDGATVIANAEDDVVMSHVRAEHHVVTFGLLRGDWHVADDMLTGPDGPLMAVQDLPRRQPHDLQNAAAVAATALAAGATRDGVAAALRAFSGLPHRVAAVGAWNGVEWYDDSKATVPHATLAAVGGFGSVVLISGGKNKGLDLSPLTAAVPPVRAVVAIGDAAAEVRAVFGPLVAVTVADSMEAAVAAAADLARPGDVVLLSPSCTSFDWYRSYGERGNDFIRIVHERFAPEMTP